MDQRYISLLLKRIGAQVIDFFVGVFALFIVFSFVVNKMAWLIPSPGIRALSGIAFYIGIMYLIQLPFMENGQTIGKGFFNLRVISTDKYRKDVTVAVMIQREILCKLMSCYLIALPLLFGKMGGHEQATHTRVIDLAHKPVPQD
jgi:uncharacterized RDD family membrane protein YckC